MRSFSQAGQDVFVTNVLPKSNGYFLEIGAGHPIEGNNTYALEVKGWKGVSVDQMEHAEWKKFRNTPVIQGNALRMDFCKILKEHKIPLTLDYLSLDIDEAQLQLVRQFPFDRIRAAAISCEHDAYRFGDSTSQEIRNILKRNNYVMIAQDISVGSGEPFEDWWIDPTKIHVTPESYTNKLPGPVAAQKMALIKPEQNLLSLWKSFSCQSLFV